MAIKFYKPTSPGRRFMSVSAFEEITCTTPEKSLLEDKRSTGGRNVHGKITVRFLFRAQILVLPKSVVPVSPVACRDKKILRNLNGNAGV